MNLLGRTAYRLWLRGDTVECPICGSRFRRFLPFGDPVRPNARCPVCGSLERHRFMWLFLSTFLTPPARVLGVSPDPGIGRRLQGMDGVSYVTVDFAAPATVRASILSLPFTGAAKELLRVTGPTGAVLIMVPIHVSYEQTFEDPSVTESAERAKAFGQSDHVRIYGLDFPGRLQNAGASVTAVRAAETFGAAEIQRHALMPDDQIFICRHHR